MPGAFPASDFDDWAENYDCSVSDSQNYPFTGYEGVLSAVFRLADAHAGHSVLDLGTGTGNLALPFARAGCDLWCTDFSAAMLARARLKIPSAHFCQHDVRTPLPGEFSRQFDRIVSSYVFHHFPLVEKVSILSSLDTHHMSCQGRIVIGDIAFADQPALDRLRIEAGDKWEEEYYWLVDESIPALETVGFKVEYTQITTCAGAFLLRKKP